MFASIVTDERCQLFCVIRTDKSTDIWTRERLSYPPSDFATAVRRASQYQQEFDPKRERFDYRVGTCD